MAVKLGKLPRASLALAAAGIIGLLALRAWAGGDAAAEPHWSLRPLSRPALPELRRADWARGPIDLLVLARLEAAVLGPSEEAPRRELIRRLTLDLHGLLPEPEDLDAFLADPAPDAYERAVDRLLGSPRFGERWARHWLDAVHYADSHGHDQDRERPNAWPYRDYVIGAFNDDLPYGRFIEEQVAGDVLFPGEPRAVPALGFLAAGPWDESSLLNIMEDTDDKRLARYLDRDDMIATAMATLISTTAPCARCHDHKFDPIPQAEYYALQAVFAGVDRAERSFDADPEVGRRRRQLSIRRASLAGDGPEARRELLGDAAQAEVAAWERALGAQEAQWTVLEPRRFESREGAALAKLGDGSILSGGPRPERDSVTIAASSALAGVTALRLEVLLDDSLPHRGPGRQDNGNLHLSEIRVFAGPAGDSAAARPVKLVHSSADFNQEGWGVERAIDGDLATAWGIHPEVGKEHAAVFELDGAWGFAAGTEWTVVLDQLHGRSHLIGRARLSLTCSPKPVRASPRPKDIAEALAAAPESRSEAQRSALARYVLLADIDRRIAALPPPGVVYAAAADFKPEGNFQPTRGRPREVHLLERGEVARPRQAASPGALSMVPGLEASFSIDEAAAEGERRAALARWLSHPRNVLAWRSIANRLWQHHFGRALAPTPNDFGRLGEPPSHPELLDLLASRLLESGGSLKDLHRRMVSSAAYRQRSRPSEDGLRLDKENRLLWRRTPGRLDAESFRDALLQSSGRLDLAMGGPPAKQFHEAAGVHVTKVADYQGFDRDSAANRRRAVYRFVFRTVPDPLLDAMDCPDASQLTPRREESTTALQALALLNDAFVVHECERLAARLERSEPDLPARVRRLYAVIFGREPDADEAALVEDYAARHGLANACRYLVNSNEFLFIP